MNQEWELFVPSSAVEARLVAAALPKQVEPSDVRLVVRTPDYQAPSIDQLRRAVRFIDGHIAAGDAVYVHCNAGKGRSSVVTAAYLIWSERNKWESASAVVRHMRSLRPDVSYGLLDWPLRSQARAVASWYEYIRAGGTL